MIDFLAYTYPGIYSNGMWFREARSLVPNGRGMYPLHGDAMGDNVAVVILLG